MSKQNIFNLIALAINMAGAYMMYHYTPKISSQLFLYTDAETESKRKRDAYKNKMVRIGMLLLFIGFLLQSIALFID